MTSSLSYRPQSGGATRPSSSPYPSSSIGGVNGVTSLAHAAPADPMLESDLQQAMMMNHGTTTTTTPVSVNYVLELLIAAQREILDTQRELITAKSRREAIKKHQQQQLQRSVSPTTSMDGRRSPSITTTQEVDEAESHLIQRYQENSLGLLHGAAEGLVSIIKQWKPSIELMERGGGGGAPPQKQRRALPAPPVDGGAPPLPSSNPFGFSENPLVATLQEVEELEAAAAESDRKNHVLRMVLKWVIRCARTMRQHSEADARQHALDLQEFQTLSDVVRQQADEMVDRLNHARFLALGQLAKGARRELALKYLWTWFHAKAIRHEVRVSEKSLEALKQNDLAMTDHLVERQANGYRALEMFSMWQRRTLQRAVESAKEEAAAAAEQASEREEALQDALVREQLQHLATREQLGASFDQVVAQRDAAVRETEELRATVDEMTGQLRDAVEALEQGRARSTNEREWSEKRCTEAVLQAEQRCAEQLRAMEQRMQQQAAFMEQVLMPCVPQVFEVFGQFVDHQVSLRLSLFAESARMAASEAVQDLHEQYNVNAAAARANEESLLNELRLKRSEIEVLERQVADFAAATCVSPMDHLASTLLSPARSHHHPSHWAGSLATSPPKALLVGHSREASNNSPPLGGFPAANTTSDPPVAATKSTTQAVGTKLREVQQRILSTFRKQTQMVRGLRSFYRWKLFASTAHIQRKLHHLELENRSLVQRAIEAKDKALIELDEQYSDVHTRLQRALSENRSLRQDSLSMIGSPSPVRGGPPLPISGAEADAAVSGAVSPRVQRRGSTVVSPRQLALEQNNNNNNNNNSRTSPSSPSFQHLQLDRNTPEGFFDSHSSVTRKEDQIRQLQAEVAELHDALTAAHNTQANSAKELLTVTAALKASRNANEETSEALDAAQRQKEALERDLERTRQMLSEHQQRNGDSLSSAMREMDEAQAAFHRESLRAAQFERQHQSAQAALQLELRNRLEAEELLVRSDIRAEEGRTRHQAVRWAYTHLLNWALVERDEAANTSAEFDEGRKFLSTMLRQTLRNCAVTLQRKNELQLQSRHFARWSRYCMLSRVDGVVQDAVDSSRSRWQQRHASELERVLQDNKEHIDELVSSYGKKIDQERERASNAEQQIVSLLHERGEEEQHSAATISRLEQESDQTRRRLAFTLFTMALLQRQHRLEVEECVATHMVPHAWATADLTAENVSRSLTAKWQLLQHQVHAGASEREDHLVEELQGISSSYLEANAQMQQLSESLDARNDEVQRLRHDIAQRWEPLVAEKDRQIRHLEAEVANFHLSAIEQQSAQQLSRNVEKRLFDTVLHCLESVTGLQEDESTAFARIQASHFHILSDLAKEKSLAEQELLLSEHRKHAKLQAQEALHVADKRHRDELAHLEDAHRRYCDDLKESETMRCFELLAQQRLQSEEHFEMFLHLVSSRWMPLVVEHSRAVGDLTVDAARAAVSLVTMRLREDQGALLENLEEQHSVDLANLDRRWQRTQQDERSRAQQNVYDTLLYVKVRQGDSYVAHERSMQDVFYTSLESLMAQEERLLIDTRRHLAVSVQRAVPIISEQALQSAVDLLDELLTARSKIYHEERAALALLLDEQSTAALRDAQRSHREEIRRKRDGETELNNFVQFLETQIVELQERLERETQSHDEMLRNEKQFSEQTQQQLHAQYEEMRIHALRDAQDRLDKELNALRKEHEEEMETMREREAVLRRAHQASLREGQQNLARAAEEQLERTQQHDDAVKALRSRHLEELGKRQAEYDQELKALQQQLTDREEQHMATVARLQKQQADQAKLLESDLHSRLSDAEAAKYEAQNETSVLRDELSRLQRSFDSLKKRNDGLAKDHDQSLEEMENLRRQQSAQATAARSQAIQDEARWRDLLEQETVRHQSDVDALNVKHQTDRANLIQQYERQVQEAKRTVAQSQADAQVAFLESRVETWADHVLQSFMKKQWTLVDAFESSSRSKLLALEQQLRHELSRLREDVFTRMRDEAAQEAERRLEALSKSHNDILRDQRAQLEALNAKLGQQRQRDSSRYEQDIAEWQRRYNESMEAAVKLQDEIQKLKNEKLLHDNDLLRDSEKALQDQKSQHAKDLANLVSENEAKRRKELGDLEKAHTKNLEELTQDLVGKMKEALKQQEDTLTNTHRKKAEDLEKEITRLKDKLVLLSDQHASALNDLENQSFAQSKEQAAAIQQRKQRLAVSLRDKQAQSSRMRTFFLWRQWWMVKAFRKDYQEMKGQLDVADGEIIRLRHVLATHLEDERQRLPRSPSTSVARSNDREGSLPGVPTVTSFRTAADSSNLATPVGTGSSGSFFSAPPPMPGTDVLPSVPPSRTASTVTRAAPYDATPSSFRTPTQNPRSQANIETAHVTDGMLSFSKKVSDRIVRRDEAVNHVETLVSEVDDLIRRGQQLQSQLSLGTGASGGSEGRSDSPVVGAAAGITSRHSAGRLTSSAGRQSSYSPQQRKPSVGSISSSSASTTASSHEVRAPPPSARTLRPRDYRDIGDPSDEDLLTVSPKTPPVGTAGQQQSSSQPGSGGGGSSSRRSSRQAGSGSYAQPRIGGRELF